MRNAQRKHTDAVYLSNTADTLIHQLNVPRRFIGTEKQFAQFIYKQSGNKIRIEVARWNSATRGRIADLGHSRYTARKDNSVAMQDVTDEPIDVSGDGRSIVVEMAVRTIAAEMAKTLVAARLQSMAGFASPSIEILEDED